MAASEPVCDHCSKPIPVGTQGRLDVVVSFAAGEDIAPPVAGGDSFRHLSFHLQDCAAHAGERVQQEVGQFSALLVEAHDEAVKQREEQEREAKIAAERAAQLVEEEPESRPVEVPADPDAPRAQDVRQDS